MRKWSGLPINSSSRIPNDKYRVSWYNRSNQSCADSCSTKGGFRNEREHHFPNPTFFVDDGVSGVTCDRPGFQAMLAEIEAERVAVCITKDLSRLGRNSALTGLYTTISPFRSTVSAILPSTTILTPLIPTAPITILRASKTGATSFMRETPAAKSALSIRQRVNAAFL